MAANCSDNFYGNEIIKDFVMFIFPEIGVTFQSLEMRGHDVSRKFNRQID